MSDPGMTLEQFRACMGNATARRTVNIDLSDDQAALVFADQELLELYYRRWVKDRAISGASSIAVAPPPAPPAPLSAQAARAGWYPVKDGRRRWWTGASWGAFESVSVDAFDVPGRMSGFVLGLIAIFFVSLPIVALPLGIIGIVKSRKALRLLPTPTRGRGLAVAGIALSIVAVSLTSVFMLLAIPGALVRNFG